MKNNILLIASFIAVLAAYWFLGAAAATGATVAAWMLLILFADYANHTRATSDRPEVLSFSDNRGTAEGMREAA
jgi:hypothetical protein